MGVSIVLGEKEAYERCLSLFEQGKVHAPLFIIEAFTVIQDKDFIFLPQAQNMIIKCIRGEMAKGESAWVDAKHFVKHMSHLWPDVVNNFCLNLMQEQKYKWAERLLPYCHGTSFIYPVLSDFSFNMAKKDSLSTLVSFVEKAMIEQELIKPPQTPMLRRKM